MMRYVELDSEHFRQVLLSIGFSEGVQNEEIVFTKPFDGKRGLVVKVYSSIRVGESTARDCGADAIRVVAIFHAGTKSYGVGKFPRVYRTGSQEKIEARTLERINAAFLRCEEWCAEQSAKFEKKNGPVGAHVGNVGDALTMDVTVVGRKPWGNKFLFTMKSGSNTFIYWSERDVLQVGESYSMRCVVKGHNTFQNVLQTEIGACFGKRIVQ